MSTTSLKKATAYSAATALFEQLASLFASSSPANALKLKPKQIDASFKALQQAPVDEVAAVNQILQEISARLSELTKNSAAGKAAKNEDSMVRGLLASARKEACASELTAEQEHSNAELMVKLRRESAAALQRRIDSKELLPPKEFQEALEISRQSINEAVKARRMFALLGPAGEYYYPAFYADGELNRRDVEKVAKVLGGIPAASKYHFFTSKSTSLGAVTPLQALKRGRLDDVLIAATAFAER